VKPESELSFRAGETQRVFEATGLSFSSNGFLHALPEPIAILKLYCEVRMLTWDKINVEKESNFCYI